MFSITKMHVNNYIPMDLQFKLLAIIFLAFTLNSVLRTSTRTRGITSSHKAYRNIVDLCLQAVTLL